MACDWRWSMIAGQRAMCRKRRVYAFFAFFGLAKCIIRKGPPQLHTRVFD